MFRLFILSYTSLLIKWVVSTILTVTRDNEENRYNKLKKENYF